MSNQRKVSTKLRWGEVETYKFVKIYLSHEYLWNSDHENYKLKDKRIKAYQAIIKDFMSSTGIRLNESDVRIKIKNLRSTYIQEVAKIRKRSNHNKSYVPTIKWFADWHRCFKHRSKNSLSYDFENDEQTHEEESNNKTWITIDTENINGEHNIDLFGTQNNNYDLIVKCDPDMTLLAEPENLNLYKMKGKKPKLQSPTIHRTFGSSINSSLESISQDDEFDIYGKYIASQLRRMNLEKALRLQLEIASLVSEARIADLSGFD